jgi:hypothetical protein
MARLGYRLLLCLLVASVVSSCATIRGFPDPPATSTANYPDPGYLLGPDAIRRYDAETDPGRKKLLRNEIIDARMAAIDARFWAYNRSLYKEDVGAGIGTDWVVLALTGATAVVGSASTKSVLGATSAALVGGQAAFDKRALFDETLPALMAQMTAQRETVRAMIRGHERLPVADYTWYAADSELQEFEYAGSIPGAIASIVQDAGAKTAAAVRELRQGSFAKTATGDALRSYWKPDGTHIDVGHQERLEAWMKRNGLDTGPGSITMFLRSNALEALRAKAAQDLGVKTGGQ